MQLRFSLRTVFVLVTMVAGACYWFMLPTIYARGFVDAVAAADYERADALFCNVDDPFLCKLNQKHWRFHARAQLKPSSFRAFIRGERRITLTVAYGDAGPMRAESWTVPVTRAGLLTPQPILRGGGSMGGGLAGPIDQCIGKGNTWPS
jgi:hypothetical protein